MNRAESLSRSLFPHRCAPLSSRRGPNNRPPSTEAITAPTELEAADAKTRTDSKDLRLSRSWREVDEVDE